MVKNGLGSLLFDLKTFPLLEDLGWLFLRSMRRVDMYQTVGPNLEKEHLPRFSELCPITFTELEL